MYFVLCQFTACNFHGRVKDMRSRCDGCVSTTQYDIKNVLEDECCGGQQLQDWHARALV